MDMISGSNGLMGAADGAMVMTRANRQEQTASLNITGRDCQDMQINLKRDPDTHGWNFHGYAEDVDPEPTDPFLAALEDLVSEKTTWKGTASELAQELHMRNPRLNFAANALSHQVNMKKKELKNQCGIEVRFQREQNAKYILLETLSDPSDMCDESHG